MNHLARAEGVSESGKGKKLWNSGRGWPNSGLFSLDARFSMGGKTIVGGVPGGGESDKVPAIFLSRPIYPERLKGLGRRDSSIYLLFRGEKEWGVWQAEGGGQGLGQGMQGGEEPMSQF